jgi:transposase
VKRRQQITFPACARLVNERRHKIGNDLWSHVDLALAKTDFSEVLAVAIDETCRAKVHIYVALVADAEQ